MKNNSNIKVTSFNYPMTSTIVAGMKSENNKSILEENAKIEKSKVGFNHIPLWESHNSNLIDNGNINKILMEKCFVASLNKIYIDSIPLDESFKHAKVKDISLYFSKVLTENVDMQKFMKECSMKSKFLKQLTEACGKKAAKMKNSVQEESSIRGMTAEEYIDDCMDTDDFISIDEYDSEEVSNIIKDKVTEVIKTEQENNQKDMDMVEEITNQKALGENVAVARVGVEDYTLFKSIMINCCKQTLNETTKQEKSIPQYSVLSESGEIKLNMDTMLMEAVVEYTRLELFNTLKISNHNVRDMKTICNKIAYNNHCQTY